MNYFLNPDRKQWTDVSGLRDVSAALYSTFLFLSLPYETAELSSVLFFKR